MYNLLFFRDGITAATGRNPSSIATFQVILN
jgi:hypothetical protein